MIRTRLGLFLIVLTSLAFLPVCGCPPLPLPPYGPEPGTYDLSEFDQFKYDPQVFGPGELSWASVTKQDQGRYVLEMQTVGTCSFSNGIRTCTTSNLGPRDLTSAEIGRLMAVFSNVQVLQTSLGGNCYDTPTPFYAWDDTEVYAYAFYCGGPISYLADDSAIQSLLNDLRASFQ